MLKSDNCQIPPEQEQLYEILLKIVNYQQSLPDGRAVELDELRRKGVLSAADLEFLGTHAVIYKPHRLSDYHAGDIFSMPTEDGGCVFIGHSGPSHTKRHAAFRVFQPLIEAFLKMSNPQEEMLLHIEFTEHDGMGVAPKMIGFILGSVEWRHRLPAIRGVAAKHGLHPFQDEEIQGDWTLAFRVSPDTARTSAAVVALLRHGCGFADDTEITYSSGALDAGLSG